MRRILQNTSSNVALHFIKIALTFVVTPVVVRALGNYDYGIWEMVIAVVGYLGVLDLGFKPTISRYAAKFNAEKDPQRLQVLFSTSLSFMGLVGGLGLIGFAVAALAFPEVLAASQDDVARYSIFLFIIGLQLFASFLGYVAESMLEGLQRYYAKNNVTIVNSLTGAAVTLLFIDQFDALIFLAVLNGVGTTTKFAAFFILLKRAQGETLAITTRYRSMAFLKESFKFSIKSFIQGIATTVESNSPPVIIGSILGPATVVFYSLPTALAKQLRSLVWTLTHAFMPLFSDLHARGRVDQMAQVYMAGSRFVVTVVVPAIVGILALGADFIARWIGPEYGVLAGDILPFVACAFLVPAINPFAGRYLTAIGQHGYIAKAAPISALSSILLSLVLIHPFGIKGVAVAIMIPPVVLTLAVTRFTCKHLGISMAAYARRVLLPVVLPAAVMAGVAWELERVIGARTYLDMVCIASVAVVAYLLIIPWVVVSATERAALVSWLSNQIARLRRRHA
jgi:O-antigen/teichoic acid export membrane protein